MNNTCIQSDMREGNVGSSGFNYEELNLNGVYFTTKMNANENHPHTGFSTLIKSY